MTTRQKLALVILWSGVAVALLIGRLGGSKPLAFPIVVSIGIMGFLTTVFIVRTGRKS